MGIVRRVNQGPAGPGEKGATMAEESTFDRIVKIVKEQDGLEDVEVTPDTKLTDLGRDSLAIAEAIMSCDTTDRLQDRSRRTLKPIRIRQSAYLNNRIEQDHRAIKRRVRPMMGFKSMSSARAILGGIEMVHMMRKGQAKYACTQQPSLAEQFERLAA